MTKAKPFIKWVGGKSQLISQLEPLLPADFDQKQDVTYIEPFVGGGAMLFHMLQAHGNISRAVINDINPDLTACYETVRDRPDELIRSLASIQEDYYSVENEEAKKAYYLRMRDRFNAKPADPVENTTLFFFLNRTCFNGLYRVNKAGKFNVPFGRYERPLICDAETIHADSRLLQRVTILTGDFEQTFEHINTGGDTFFYFDPPYRPLSDTSSFNDYAKEAFNDAAQMCGDYSIDRGWVSRSVNVGLLIRPVTPRARSVARVKDVFPAPKFPSKRILKPCETISSRYIIKDWAREVPNRSVSSGAGR